MMFKSGDVCPLEGVYRYSGHPDNSKGCHPKWYEKDILLQKNEKFPSVGSCKNPAQWIFVRPR